VNNLVPDWNNLVYGPVAGGAKGAALDKQFPEFTGRILPRAVRGILHASTSTTNPVNDKDDRMRASSTARMAGMDRPARAGTADR